jgi:integrase/recombinase XerD
VSRWVASSSTVGTFFVSDSGAALSQSSVHQIFTQLITGLGLRSDDVRPRMHDLRSFAVRTLINWHRGGQDVEARIPALATYMGHVGPASTYWYLSAAPELMQLAAQRLGGRFGGQS